VVGRQLHFDGDPLRRRETDCGLKAYLHTRNIIFCPGGVV
jgi:hypothetical protein